MIDYQNPTLEQIENLIPDSARYFCEALGDDWCHPIQLRQLRGLANKIAPKKTPETHSREYMADIWLDVQSNCVIEKWSRLINAWTEFDKIDADYGGGAYGRLLSMIIGNFGANWKYFDAPMIVWKEYHE